MRAPFPYFGGKTRAALVIWEHLGDVANYIEPFAGSLGVLLNRPHDPQIETVNDLDGHICNVWRSIAQDPGAVAAAADWPVNEADLHARHIHLVNVSGSLTDRLMGDPLFCDPVLAGWWVWGACSWIGSGWCSGDGPWASVDGVITHLGNAGRGVNRQLPHLGNAGRGVNRQLPHLSNAGQGLNRPGQHIEAWMQQLSDRLRRVRVACGDWSRVLGPSSTTRLGLTGVVVDPPYSVGSSVYAVGGPDAALVYDVVRWCAENGNHPLLRIALCGYTTEGLHDQLLEQGWTVEYWHAQGGYQGAEDRERVWFSPHCLGNTQGTLW
jgi:DNA adenine methylase